MLSLVLDLWQEGFLKQFCSMVSVNGKEFARSGYSSIKCEPEIQAFSVPGRLQLGINRYAC